ncbi:MAG: ATP-binding cassette domain-containing protein, partial [Alcanivoracaceae bacterium]|nr:ATP-binding cassette domain-containing protein [Alcanivoracaceae bacterium]
MLEVKDLHASVQGKDILKGLSLTVKPGEVHAIMGPNGSGKSTLSNVLAGRDGYEITGGEALFEGQSLADMEPEERARTGIFLAFQYPVEIPGVSNMEFLKASLEEIYKAQGKEPLDAVTLLRKAREACQ